MASRLREAEVWALVLSSQAIPAQLLRRSDGIAVAVSSEDGERALEVLDLYDRENTRRAPVAPIPEYGPTRLAIGVSAGLVLLFFVTGPPELGSPWFERGAASAERILAGEFWRSATALMLHADVTHVLGNAVGFAVFGTAVFRAFGPGVGALLVLVAGVVGNLLNAWLHGAQHHSVGFSTAVFAAIGILAGLQFGRARARALAGRQGLARAWLPLAAALGLLAMLGMGERADLSAHLLGLVSGVLVGAAAELSISAVPRTPAQVAPGGIAGVALLCAWGLAFAAP